MTTTEDKDSELNNCGKTNRQRGIMSDK